MAKYNLILTAFSLPYILGKPRKYILEAFVACMLVLSFKEKQLPMNVGSFVLHMYGHITLQLL